MLSIMPGVLLGALFVSTDRHALVQNPLTPLETTISWYANLTGKQT